MNEACINSSNIKFETSPIYQTFTTPNTDSIASHPRSVYLLTNCQPTVVSGGGGTINKLVQDSQHYNTLWFASTSGVYRSITSGTAWSSILSLTNCRALIVDSTNTTNAMAGGETGVYRIVNGASTQITTGLGNHNIMLSLTQSTGAPGDRRRVWVGTSGGVFMGAEPIELQ